MNQTESYILIGALRGYSQAMEFVAQEFGVDLFPDLGGVTPPDAGDVLPSFAAGPSRSAGPSHCDGSHVTAPGLGDADPTPESETSTKGMVNAESAEWGVKLDYVRPDETRATEWTVTKHPSKIRGDAFRDGMLAALRETAAEFEAEHWWQQASLLRARVDALVQSEFRNYGADDEMYL